MFTSFMLALTMTSVAAVLVISSLNPLFTALLARRVPAPTHCLAHLAGHRAGRPGHGLDVRQPGRRWWLAWVWWWRCSFR